MCPGSLLLENHHWSTITGVPTIGLWLEFLGIVVADKKIPTMYCLFNVVNLIKKWCDLNRNFTLVDAVSALLLVAVVSTGFFYNRMFEFLTEVFMMGMSQLHCIEHSNKKFVRYLSGL